MNIENLNAQEIAQKLKEAVVENNYANDVAFADWRDANHIIDTYMVDDEGRSVELNAEIREEVREEMEIWLTVSQRLESADSENGRAAMENMK